MSDPNDSVDVWFELQCWQHFLSGRTVFFLQAIFSACQLNLGSIHSRHVIIGILKQRLAAEKRKNKPVRLTVTSSSSSTTPRAPTEVSTAALWPITCSCRQSLPGNRGSYHKLRRNKAGVIVTVWTWTAAGVPPSCVLELMCLELGQQQFFYLVACFNH